jgi:hypothetical protein
VSPYFVLRIKEWEKLVWHLAIFEAENFAYHRDGRLWEDTASLILLTGVPIVVSIHPAFVTTPDIPRFKHVAYVDESTLSSIKADL